MAKKMLIDAAHAEEVRVCVMENGKVDDFDFEFASRKPLRGNIYLARVTRVEPSLQAAFVEFGGNRHGFLAFNEIHPDYYQIPVSDREKLQEADAEEARLARELDLLDRDDDEEEAGASFAQDDDGTDNDGAYSDDDEDDLRGGLRDEDELSDDLTANADAEENADTEENQPAGDEDDAPALTADAEQADPTQAEAEIEPEAQDTPDAAAQEEAEDKEQDDADTTAKSVPLESFPTPVATKSLDDDDGEDEAADETANEASDDAVAEASDGDETVADEEPEEATKETKKDAKAEKRAARNALLEEYKAAKRHRAQLLRNYKIQEVIKRRQILLVQAVKEERGNKGAALTTYMSLAGRYCVLMPNTARGGGISRKIPNASDRKRLRRVVDSLDVAQGMGLIIRTAGAKRTKTEIKRDFDYLTRLWENIRSLTLESIAPCLIYEEASLIKRAIRDLYDKDIGSVLVDGEDGYREAKDFMKMLMPSHAKNVQPYKDKVPIFVRHDAEKQLDAMYQPSVRLKSGGYIVIHQTEALIAVDVNSGKATRERNIELTALKTNLEAATETARQCRLRDLAGLIVIDFIDMDENKNNRAVEKRLKEALKLDRARIQVGRISNFGLLEMSRQRRRSGIVDGTTIACETCNGAGVVRSNEMAALRILRAIESEAVGGRSQVVSVRCAMDVGLFILNHKRDWLAQLENLYGVQAEVICDPEKFGDHYALERRGPAVTDGGASSVVRADTTELPAEAEQTDIETEEEDEQAEKPAKRRRRRRRRKKSEDGDEIAAEQTEQSDDQGEDNADEPHEHDASDAERGSEEDGEEPKKRRRRGRRGGRRKNRRNAEEDAAAPSQEGDQPQLDASNEEAALKDDGAYADPDHSAAPAEPIAANPATTEESMDASVAPAPSTADISATPLAATALSSSADDEPAELATADAVPTAPSPEEVEERVKKRKSSRKGWWSRALGG